MKFNLNQYVKIKLTDYGRHVMKVEHDAIRVYFPKSEQWERVGHFIYPEEDSEGWSKWQLHCVFETFGKYVGMGKQVPFETTIIILEDPL